MPFLLLENACVDLSCGWLEPLIFVIVYGVCPMPDLQKLGELKDSGSIGAGIDAITTKAMK